MRQTRTSGSMSAVWKRNQGLASEAPADRRDGQQTSLTEDDGKALVAYLRSLPPIRPKAPEPAPVGEELKAPYLTLVNAK